MIIIATIIINKSNLIGDFEHDGRKIGNGECKITCVAKNTKC